MINGNYRERIHLNRKHLVAIPRLFGIKQREFAKRLGISQSHLSHMVRGKAALTTQLNDRIVREFNIDSNTIFVLDAMDEINKELKEGERND